jgi:hypothetical protein
MYDSSVGRWLEQDPLGLAAGPNPYEYVGNDPTNATDPTGLLPPVPSPFTKPPAPSRKPRPAPPQQGIDLRDVYFQAFDKVMYFRLDNFDNNQKDQLLDAIQKLHPLALRFNEDIAKLVKARLANNNRPITPDIDRNLAKLEAELAKTFAPTQAFVSGEQLVKILDVTSAVSTQIRLNSGITIFGCEFARTDRMHFVAHTGKNPDNPNATAVSSGFNRAKPDEAQIDLYKLFWDEGLDDKVGTLYHEMTHIYAFTSHHENGPTDDAGRYTAFFMNYYVKSQ